MNAPAEWVIVRIVTDETGHPSVSVVGALFRGENAEADCYREMQRLNAESRKNLMEVFLARRVGDESPSD
jgi:hypothetical protein